MNCRVPWISLKPTGPLRFAFAALFLAGCAGENIKETGITSEQAESIAKSSPDNAREGYTDVDRSDWNRKSQSWVVALQDRSGDHGRVYKINRDGQIVGTKVIDQNPEDDNYWPDTQPAPTRSSRR